MAYKSRAQKAREAKAAAVVEKKETTKAPTSKAVAVKKSLISNIVKKAEKKLGEESVRVLGDSTVSSKVSFFISTGNSELNKALGLPGVPVGRIIEIYGAESSGKTTLAQTIGAQCQKLGGVVIYIDTEFALDPERAATLGLDIDDVILIQPETAEEATETLEVMINVIRTEDADVPIVVVWDSVAASPTKKELEEGKAQVGELARIMSSHLRQVRGLISKSNVVAIYVNQTREKIGVLFGDNITTPGKLLNVI